MNDFEETESMQEQSVMAPVVQYESCPHCQRSFFMGKLKYHLKLCNEINPMLISPRKPPSKSQQLHQLQQNYSLFSNQQTKCPKCQTKLPAFLLQRHVSKCQLPAVSAQIVSSPVTPNERDRKEQQKGWTDTHFKEKEQVILPAIKGSARQTRTKKMVVKDSYQVKLREELSCFRIAQEIKQVQCNSCGRIFSKQASLRHIPICQALKVKADKSIALRRKKVNPNSSVLGKRSFNISSQRDNKSRSLVYEQPLSKSPQPSQKVQQEVKGENFAQI